MRHFFYHTKMISPTIKAGNLIIRPFEAEDAELWQTWDTDPEVQAHMPEPQNTHQDISEQLEYIKECESDEEGYYWSVETDRGETIGTVSLFQIHPYHKTAEIGVVIGNKNYWGKGVATETIRAVTDYAFSKLGIERISAEVEESNLAMKKVFEKIGFKEDGHFKAARIKAGKRIDVFHFGILK